MSKDPITPDDRLDRTVPVGMTRGLLRTLDQLRTHLQAYLGGDQVVSRADVMRLGLRRLALSWLVHLSEGTAPPRDLMEQYDGLVTQMHQEGTCPDWLVPGPGPAKPARGKSKRTATIKEGGEA